MCDFSALSATVEGSSELCSAATRKLCAPICCSRFQFFDFLILHFLGKLLKEDPQILNRAWRSPRHAQGSLTYCYYKGIDAGQPVLHSCSVQSPSRTLYRRNPSSLKSVGRLPMPLTIRVMRTKAEPSRNVWSSPETWFRKRIDSSAKVLPLIFR